VLEPLHFVTQLLLQSFDHLRTMRKKRGAPDLCNSVAGRRTSRERRILIDARLPSFIVDTLSAAVHPAGAVSRQRAAVNFVP
jgi:hypothetical protein